MPWIPPMPASSDHLRRVAAPRPFRHISAPLGPRSIPRQLPHYKHSEWRGKEAYLRVSQTIGTSWFDLKAVCSRHPQCGRSRSCRAARPLGELWAWLSFMHSESCSTKAAHCAYQPSFEARCAARAQFKGLPNVEEFLAAEAVLADGSDEPQ